jgi:hypothetical protein
MKVASSRLAALLAFLGAVFLGLPLFLLFLRVLHGGSTPPRRGIVILLLLLLVGAWLIKGSFDLWRKDRSGGDRAG